MCRINWRELKHEMIQYNRMMRTNRVKIEEFMLIHWHHSNGSMWLAIIFFLKQVVDSLVITWTLMMRKKHKIHFDWWFQSSEYQNWWKINTSLDAITSMRLHLASFAVIFLILTRQKWKRLEIDIFASCYSHLNVCASEYRPKLSSRLFFQQHLQEKCSIFTITPELHNNGRVFVSVKRISWRYDPECGLPDSLPGQIYTISPFNSWDCLIL